MDRVLSSDEGHTGGRRERAVHVQQRRRASEKRDVRWLTEEVKERP